MDVFGKENLISVFKGESKEEDNYVDEYKNYFLQACFKKTLTSFWEESKQYEYALDSLKEHFGVESDDEKRKIYNLAAIDTIANLTRSMVQRQPVNVEKYIRYKYVLNVIQTLYDYGPLSVAMIAKYINVERHALTNVMSRAKKLGLWENERIGKYSLYMLTPLGEKVYEQYKEKSVVEDEDDVEEMLVTYTEMLAKKMDVDHPDVLDILREISQKENINIKKSSMLGIQIQKIYEKRDEYVKACIVKVNVAKKKWESEHNENILPNDFSGEYIDSSFKVSFSDNLKRRRRLYDKRNSKIGREN